MESVSSEKGTIAIDFVREALVCLRTRNIDAESLLIESGISPELLDLPLARVSSLQFGQLWHRIAQTMDDEFFGMDRRRMKAGSFTLLCHSIIHADTLELALRRAIRFFGIVLDDLACELVRDGKEARIILRDAGDPKRAFAYGALLMMLHGLGCWLVGRRIPLHSAHFRCAEPSFAPEWAVLFTHTLLFDQDCSGISFPSEYLAMENVQTEKSMKDFLRSAPANFLVKYKNSTTLAARIRRMLRDIPPPDWPDFNQIADQFHASPATLRRRLAEEGQSYRGIMDELRHDLAITLLSNTDRSVFDIANDLGFAEPSAFYRAFKKWTGSRPSQYRLVPVPE